MKPVMPHYSEIVNTILGACPNTQAIYLFGSFATGNEHAGSDVDIALLLPHPSAKQAGSLMMSDLRFRLEQQLHQDVDLINLRLVSTVLQKEVIAAGRRVYTSDIFAAA